jgi:hypothetical protein
LTQLTPGIHYRYRVETNSGLVAEGWLRAAPARAAGFTFAVVSDFGNGTRDERAVASMIEGWHPDFAAVVVLDSDVSVWPGSPQLRFARRSLALDSCFRFAAWHHPPWEPPGRPHSSDLRRNIVPLVEKDGVRVVFVGHLHDYARSRPRHGVVYVAVGTGGATLDSDARKLTIPLGRIVQGRFGALRVDEAPREARFSYETVDGRVRDHFRVTCSTATLPRPSSTP